MVDESKDLIKTVNAGIRLCRKGKWEQGLRCLHLVADAPSMAEFKERLLSERLPSAFGAYLGYGMARFEGREKEGLELCKTSAALNFHDAENYLYLAKTYGLLNRNVRALRTLHIGLTIHPDHLELQALRRELGIRRDPVLGFLPRSHPVNRTLGKLRHKILTRLFPVSDEGAREKAPEGKL